MTDDLKARLRERPYRLLNFGRDTTEAADRIEALEAELVKARRVIKGWANWHRRVEDDPKDDLPYLNGKAWDDAEALANNSETFLRSAALAGGGDE